MTAQKWLDELERLREAATPGPWVAGEVLDSGTVVRGHNMIIDCRHTPDEGCFGKHNAAYIVAACNAVPRLVEMLVFIASLASEDDESADAIDRRIQWAYNETRSKEWKLSLLTR